MEDSKLAMAVKPVGTVIFRQGDDGKAMYKIVAGKAGVYLNYDTPEQVELAVLGEQSCFGEMAILNGEKRTATVVVLEQALLLEVTKERFIDFIVQNPNNALNIMTNLAKSLANNTEKIGELATQIDKDDQETKSRILDEGLRRYYNYVVQQHFGNGSEEPRLDCRL